MFKYLELLQGVISLYIYEMINILYIWYWLIFLLTFDHMNFLFCWIIVITCCWLLTRSGLFLCVGLMYIILYPVYWLILHLISLMYMLFLLISIIIACMFFAVLQEVIELHLCEYSLSFILFSILFSTNFDWYVNSLHLKNLGRMFVPV